MKHPALQDFSRLDVLQFLEEGYQAGLCNDHTALDFLLLDFQSKPKAEKRVKLSSPLKAAKRPILLIHPKKGRTLSPKEGEVLNWIAEGKTNWEISLILSVSENTIKFHVKNLMRKLDAKNRHHLVAKSYGINGSN